jgi:mRNA interferase HigB
MKVHLLKLDTIEAFVEDHANSRIHFENFLNRIEHADWSVPQDIVATCKGNLIGGNRIVFDLGGNGRNAFRMICEFLIGRKEFHIYVNWIGTHEDYNSLTPKEKMEISIY